MLGGCIACLFLETKAYYLNLKVSRDENNIKYNKHTEFNDIYIVNNILSLNIASIYNKFDLSTLFTIFFFEHLFNL